MILSYIDKFWGKARPSKIGPRWHPLSYHLLDVAAVGAALLERHSPWRRWLSQSSGLPEEEASALFLYALALHDLGKFSHAFQAKAVEAFSAIHGRNPASANDPGHDSVGRVIWMDCIQEGEWAFGPNGLVWPSGDKHARTCAGQWVLAAIGHHGRPARSADRRDVMDELENPASHGRNLSAAMEYSRDVASLVGLPLSANSPKLERGAFKRSSWVIAGLTVLCDWVGSNSERWFPYEAPKEGGLAAYWPCALEKARRAIADAGLRPTPLRAVPDLNALLPEGAVPSNLQKFTSETEVGEGPALYLFEDLTGSGKTEAALALAQRLIGAGAADGIYLGLPTQATANAMEGRVRELVPSLWGQGAEPSLILAHGKARVAFALREAAARKISETGDADTTGTASANAWSWLAHDRRTALLADIGIGTLDQAILGVLPSRFQSIRLAGLARKVLIADEVHAYDAYTFGLLKGLLRFQGAARAPAIILSATLPSRMRRELIAAYAGKEVGERDDPGGYPLATVWRDGRVSEHKISPAEGAVRCVNITRLNTPDEALLRLITCARSGGCAAYIRNTVPDAREAFESVSALAPDLSVTLFHSRFTLGDRLDIEAQAQACFGKQSANDDRKGRILIATQVVEQSLDLDFDIMASDLAPVDALIQRAGRLHRHRRPGRTSQPELLLVSAAPETNADRNWYARAFPRAQWVYRDHAQLWRTARLLAERGALRLPQETRALIEGVYGSNALSEVPEPLIARANEAEGTRNADMAAADNTVLVLGDGYAAACRIFEDDAKVQTRNADPQVTLRLARIENGQLRPWADHEDPWLAWRLSDVSARANWISEVHRQEGAIGAQAQSLIGMWPDGPSVLLVVLERGAEGLWRATGRDPAGRTVRISYGKLEGIKVDAFPT